MSFAASVLAFFIVSTFLHFKSFYPYTFSFQTYSHALPYASVLILEQKLKVALSNGEKGFIYIDSVQKAGTEVLKFYGRYTSVHPADTAKAQETIRYVLGLEVADFFAESACVIGVDTSQPNLLNQVGLRNEKVLKCVEKIKSEIAFRFEVSSFNFIEDARLKKIIFLALTVAIFFGAAVLALLESFNVFKKD